MNKPIALVTDLHLNEPFTIKNGVDGKARLNIILNDITARGIEDLMFLGDLGEGEGIAWFFEAVKNANLNLQYVLGNHDQLTWMAEYDNLDTFSELGKLYYTTENENFKTIYLDYSAGEVDADQLAWFAKHAETPKPLILFIHHPILDCKTEMDIMYPLLGRTHLEKILKSRTNKTQIFCGHYHIDDVQKDGLIEQVITPAGSIQLDRRTSQIDPNDKSFGYRLLYIDGANISHETVWL